MGGGRLVLVSRNFDGSAPAGGYLSCAAPRRSVEDFLVPPSQLIYWRCPLLEGVDFHLLSAVDCIGEEEGGSGRH